MSYLFHVQNVYGPFLVVVPLSTMTAWIKELRLWAREMNVVAYHGSKQSREIIVEHEFYFPSSQKLKFNVLLTTYETLVADANVLGNISWQSLMVDEAHRLKNEESQLHITLSSFKHAHRVLITGTPLQVHLSLSLSAVILLARHFFSFFLLLACFHSFLSSLCDRTDVFVVEFAQRVVGVAPLSQSPPVPDLGGTATHPIFSLHAHTDCCCRTLKAHTIPWRAQNRYSLCIATSSHTFFAESKQMSKSRCRKR